MKGGNQRGRMTDPVSVVEKIFELTREINKATDAVEYNARACGDMKRMMSNVNSSVSRLKNEEEMTTVLNDRTTRDALDHLEKTLRDSHELVQKCQEKQNPLQRLLTAPDLSKKLQQAKEDISQKVNVLNFVLKVNDLGRRNLKRPSVRKPGGLVSALRGWKRQPQQHHQPPQISVTTTPAPHGHWTSKSDAPGSGTMARRTSAAPPARKSTSTRRSGTPSGSVRKMPGDHPTKGAHKSTATRRSKTPVGSVQQLLGDRPTDGLQNPSNVNPNKEI